MTLLRPGMKAKWTLKDGRVIELEIGTEPVPDDDESEEESEDSDP